MNSDRSSESTNGTSPAGSVAREAALTAAAAGVVVVFCASLLFVDRGFFWIDDAQNGALPGYCEINRAWRSGEAPLLSRCSWRSAGIAGEYSSGVFSPSLNLSILLAFGLDLPLPLTSAVLSIIHLAILAAGTFRLARQRGLTVDVAILVTLVGALNGWIIYWGARNWGVCLFSFAWLPWVWWALERSRDERHGWTRFVLPGIFLYLLITAGWHFTVLMAGIVTLWLMLRTWAEKRRPLAVWPCVAAWAVGLGLSSPAWMMFLEYIANTARGQRQQVYFSDSWMVSLDNLPNLVFPHFISYSGVYYDSPHMGIELTGGLVPLVILASALFRRGSATFRALRWECGLCAFLFLLIASPSFGNFRFSFRWLPLFFLALGILAGQTLALQRTATGSSAFVAGRIGLPNLGRWCFFLVLVVWGRALMLAFGPMLLLSSVGLGFLVVSFFWLQVEQRCAAASFLRRWMPSAVVLATCWLTYATCEPFFEIATWDIAEKIRNPEPLDPTVRYISLYTREDIWDNDPTRLMHPSKGIGGELYMGNTAMYSGLDFVSGYSATGPAGMEEVLPFRCQGYGSPEGIESLLENETGPQGLLELLGVDGLVMAERFAAYRPRLVANGWEEVAQVRGGIVFHRKGPHSPRVRAVSHAEVIADRTAAKERLTGRAGGPVPLILLGQPATVASGTVQFVPVAVTTVADERNAVVVDVAARSEGEALIVFSRPWFPGYRAAFDGKPVPVELADLMLPAVRLPAGSEGRLVLEYRPRSLVVGASVAATTASFVVAVLLLTLGQRFRRGRKAPDAEAGANQRSIASPLLSARLCEPRLNLEAPLGGGGS
jgi:hypothetical protein